MVEGMIAFIVGVGFGFAIVTGIIRAWNVGTAIFNIVTHDDHWKED